MNCTQCNKVIDQKFCPNCGQPATIKRFDGHFFSAESPPDNLF